MAALSLSSWVGLPTCCSAIVQMRRPHLETMYYSRPSISTNYGVRLISGIGISCFFHGVAIHFVYNKTEAHLVVMARNFGFGNGVLNSFKINRRTFQKLPSVTVVRSQPRRLHFFDEFDALIFGVFHFTHGLLHDALVELDEATA